MKQKLLYMLVVSSVLLVGCGSQNKEVVEESSTPVASSDIPESAVGEYPIVIDNAFGQTVINEKPVNIVSISWGNQDVPLALGVAPVGVSKANFGLLDANGLSPWTAHEYENLGTTPITFDETDGLDFEAINDANPDVILAAYSGITKEDYDMLSQIAPVVAYKNSPWQTSWREQIELNSKGIGMEAEGLELISSLETLIAEKVANYPTLNGKTVAFMYFNPADLGNFYVYTPIDPRVSYLEDLGMVVPQNIIDLGKNSSEFAIKVSAEYIEELNDVDLIVTYGDTALLDALKNDKLLGTVPAIKNGSVAIIDVNSAVGGGTTPSALSIPYTIDGYLKLLSDALGQE